MYGKTLSRKTSCDDTYLPQTEPATFPVTPIKAKEGFKQNQTPNYHGLETPTSSIRERRGRHHIMNGSFHPLSVFTKSALFPFALDTDKALESLNTNKTDCLEAATCVNVAEQGRDKRDQESRMDLMTALRTTSPEKDSTSEIHADFTTLYHCPIPEPSQHPCHALDPFKVISELPLLSTSTNVDEIKPFNHKHRRESQAKVLRESLERKRSFLGLELRTPSTARSKNTLTNGEDSPVSALVPTPSTANTCNSFKCSSSPSAFEYNTPKESASILSANASVRKFSDLFRKKDSMEKTLDSPIFSPRSSQDSPNLDRHDLEAYLRRTTSTPIYDFDPSSPYPRHPTTGRGWKSRNLKCTTCSPDPCAVCHRLCCAFRAAVLALDTHNEGSPGRPVALHRIQEITKVFPYGKEAPTFLQCTTASVSGSSWDGMVGCGRYVCPDCCSVCPDECCADTLCRKCKPVMWKECDWHKPDLVMMLSYQH